MSWSDWSDWSDLSDLSDYSQTTTGWGKFLWISARR